MAQSVIGRGGIYGFATLAFGITSISGYISPKFESLSLTNESDFTEEMAQDGTVVTAFGNNRGVQCRFSFKPQGTAAAPTVADAVKSAGIPIVMAGVTITGLKIIAFAGFTDVFNTDAGNTQPWIYTGTGSLDGTNDGLWTATMTLKRYLGITSVTPFS
jgi:hypothetical protein